MTEVSFRPQGAPGDSAGRHLAPTDTGRRRLWSAAALLLTFAALVLAVVVVVTAFPAGLSVLLCLVAALGTGWWGLVRRGAERAIGIGSAALLLAGAITLVIVENRLLENLLVAAAFVGGVAAARMAFRVHVEWPAAKPPQHPVLFYNPKSGGGKATRFHLAEEARRRGIESVELKRGDDLERLVRNAVEAGADALAMAGGDGSQAIVAKVAAEHGLPYACIPAGTRNHFALDLGVDRDDVVGALDALVDGGERVVDLAEVNGRVFVNNVSLGLYADAVQRPGYREAKIHTLLDTVPDVIGPDAAPPALLWQGPDGPQSAVAILISNDQYRLGKVLGSGTRPRLDRGTLGITVLAPLNAAGDRGAAHGQSREQWTTATFEVRADQPVATGIDGEAITLDPPLRFQTRPAALRVRIAPHHPGVSPSAIEPDSPWQAAATLAGFAIHGGGAEPVEAR